MKALIGTKLGMTSVISEDGVAQAVTLVQAAPNTVTAVKTDEKDGYRAVQLATVAAKTAAKPQAGQAKAVKLNPGKMAEFRTDEQPALGDRIDVTAFSVGDTVKVTGRGKGKGFTGTIKRHNFHRGPKTHGSRNYRRPGSIGSMYPQKVFKGKKMAGRAGGGLASIRNLKVALVEPEHSIIGLSGTVPGPKRGTVKIEGI